MFYVAVVALEFFVTIVGVVCVVTYYNHKR